MYIVVYVYIQFWYITMEIYSEDKTGIMLISRRDISVYGS